MPKLLALLTVLIATSSTLATARAQYGESEAAATPSSTPPLMEPRLLKLTAHVGYAFGGSVSEGGGSLSLDGGPTLGVLASYGLPTGGRIFLSFTQQDNRAEVRGTSGIDEYDLILRTLQFGGSLDMPLRPTGGRVWPHFAFSIGATQFDPDYSRYETDWTFSWIVEGGVTVWLIKCLGLTALARLHGHVVQSENAALCSGGCVYLRDTTLLVEGEVGAGVTLAL
ncbi:MAG TPA: hypothetical protein VJR89_33985 [Polyangiales bacterium]|nr:hypothetical protein [Polyangiales bacterium]